MLESTKIAIAAVAGLGVGAAVTYFATKKHIERKYQEIADEEIASVKRRYDLINSQGEFEDQRKRTHEYLRVVDELQYRATHGSEDDPRGNTMEPEDIDLNMPDMMPEHEDIVIDHGLVPEAVDLDYTKEVRTPDRPYVISFDEAFEDEDRETVNLSYFRKGNTLMDDREDPNYDINSTVGQENLLRFGHGSKDPNIVYIRNEKLDTNFEVTLEEGSYEEVVLGYESTE